VEHVDASFAELFGVYHRLMLIINNFINTLFTS